MFSSHKYYAAKSATYLFYKLLEYNRDWINGVIVPDYNCHHFYRPLVELGIPTIRLGHEEYELFLNGKTREEFIYNVVLVVHYFGQQSEYTGFDSGVLVIEDCSHTTNSILPENPEVSYLYTPYKHLSLPRCGVLYLSKTFTTREIGYSAVNLDILVYLMKKFIRKSLGALSFGPRYKQDTQVCCPPYKLDVYGKISLAMNWYLKNRYFIAVNNTRLKRRAKYNEFLGSDMLSETSDTFILPIRRSEGRYNKEWPDIFCNQCFEETKLKRKKIGFYEADIGL